jgi:Zn-dependent peptidase ImmA (M78 family)
VAAGSSFRGVDLARRIAAARGAARLSLDELAARSGIPSSVLADIERGDRLVTTTELVALGDSLDRPVDWFVDESPPAVVSRRQHPAFEATSPVLEVALEQLARDVSLLQRTGLLRGTERERLPPPTDVFRAERLADRVREMLDQPGPLLDLQQAAESLGLLAFSLDLGNEGGDAAYVEVDSWGVSLINGALEPGRRRFNLAHEIGHHVTGDAFAVEPTVGGPSETERLFNAFAVHLLLPRAAVSRLWSERREAGRRLAALEVAIRFRASWSAVCNQLQNLGLISADERDRLVETPPNRGEHLQIGQQWQAELEPPSVPMNYARTVLNAYVGGRLTPERTVELLHGAVTLDELPAQEPWSFEQLRREFDRLP